MQGEHHGWQRTPPAGAAATPTALQQQSNQLQRHSGTAARQLHTRSPSPAPRQTTAQASTGAGGVLAAAGSTRAGGGTGSVRPSPSPQPSVLRQAVQSHAGAVHSGIAAVQPSRARAGSASVPNSPQVQSCGGQPGAVQQQYRAGSAAAVPAHVQWWGAPVAGPPGFAQPTRTFYEVGLMT
jgi:hypothetical protein